MRIQVRPYRQADARALTDIFYDSIHSVGPEYYSAAQVNAWAPLPRDYMAWQARFAGKPPFVATFKDQIVGFITLEPDGHIDWTYTHKDYQRQGVATALYDYLEKQAKSAGMGHLYVEASHLARPFFASRGFVLVRQNQVRRGREILVNWSMEKLL